MNRMINIREDRYTILKKRIKSNFFLHDVKIQLITNSIFINRLISDYLYYYKNKSKTKFSIRFILIELDPKKHSIFPADFYKDHYIFKYCVKGITIKVVAELQNNTVKGYVAPFHLFTKEELLYQIFFKPLGHILKRNDIFFIHASALVKDKEGILICGQPNSGKSTFAISLVRRGFRLLGDDTPLLKNTNSHIKVLSFMEKVGVKTKLFKFFPELKILNSKENQDSPRIRFNLEKVYERSIAKECIPKLIVFPRLIIRGKTKIEAISNRETLQELFTDENFIHYSKKGKGLIKDLSKKHFNVLFNLANQVRAYKVFYREKDVSRVGKMIEKLIK